MNQLSTVDFLLIAITLQAICTTAVVAYLIITKPKTPVKRNRLPKATVAAVNYSAE